MVSENVDTAKYCLLCCLVRYSGAANTMVKACRSCSMYTFGIDCICGEPLSSDKAILTFYKQIRLKQHFSIFFEKLFLISMHY